MSIIDHLEEKAGAFRRRKVKALRENIESLIICQEVRKKIGDWLELLRKHDHETYCHCFRTSFICMEVARLLGLDPKPLVYAGLLHDIGKVKVNPEILRKTKGFTEEDYGEVKEHPLVGYLILKEAFPFSAEILLRHHKFQEDSYPENLPDNQYAPEEISLIEKYARLLARVDSCDASFNRKNQKFSNAKSREDLQNLMIELSPDKEELIKDWFSRKIF